MRSNVLDVHRRALSDYRIALGLELQSRRKKSEYSLEELASCSNIPAEALRSYEKGASLPQLVRIVDIGNVYGVSLFEILESTAEYIYRASGDPAPNHANTSVDQIALRAAILYCGVTPAQLRMMEVQPRRRETISEDFFGEKT
jgi:transcriptional regulator with XRE-family HTH domain